jgi:hypothetical protein
MAKQEIIIKYPEPAATGCWTVLIEAGKLRIAKAQRKQFLITPDPTLTEATIDENAIVVKGTDLIDAASCGAPLKFQLVSATDTSKTVPLILSSVDTPRKVLKFELPKEAKGGSWKVQIVFKGKTKETALTTQ